jgi:hypothetical protein
LRRPSGLSGVGGVWDGGAVRRCGEAPTIDDLGCSLLSRSQCVSTVMRDKSGTGLAGGSVKTHGLSRGGFSNDGQGAWWVVGWL